MDVATSEDAAGDEFRAVFDRVPYPILLFDDERRYIGANRAAREWFIGEGDDADDVTGNAIGVLSPPELRDGLPALWDEFVRRGRLHGEWPLVLADGKTRMVQYAAHANYLPGRHLVVLRTRGGGARRPRRTDRRVLTRREAEVLQRLAVGSSGADIARELFLSPTTVQTHVRNAMRKLGARSRAHAVMLALASGEIEA